VRASSVRPRRAPRLPANPSRRAARRSLAASTAHLDSDSSVLLQPDRHARRAGVVAIDPTSADTRPGRPTGRRRRRDSGGRGRRMHGRCRAGERRCRRPGCDAHRSGRRPLPPVAAGAATAGRRAGPTQPERGTSATCARPPVPPRWRFTAAVRLKGRGHRAGRRHDAAGAPPWRPPRRDRGSRHPGAAGVGARGLANVIGGLLEADDEPRRWRVTFAVAVRCGQIIGVPDGLSLWAGGSCTSCHPTPQAGRGAHHRYDLPNARSPSGAAMTETASERGSSVCSTGC